MITIIGGGLAGSEAAWQAASEGVPVQLYEMRPGRSTPVHRTGRLAELGDMESLVAIAQRYDRLILHQRHEGVHYYLVEDDGAVYRYQAREEGAEQELRLASDTEAATPGRDVVVAYPEQPAEGALIPGGDGRRYGTRRFRRRAGRRDA